MWSNTRKAGEARRPCNHFPGQTRNRTPPPAGGAEGGGGPTASCFKGTPHALYPTPRYKRCTHHTAGDLKFTANLPGWHMSHQHATITKAAPVTTHTYNNDQTRQRSCANCATPPPMLSLSLSPSLSSAEAPTWRLPSVAAAVVALQGRQDSVGHKPSAGAPRQNINNTARSSATDAGNHWQQHARLWPLSPTKQPHRHRSSSSAASQLCL